jgi:hypothetical protein
MAKTRSTRAASPISAKTSAAQSPFRAGPVIINTLICVALLSGVVGAYHACRQSVELDYPPYPPKVVLINRPPWMTDALANQIIDSAQPIRARSAFDRQILIDTANALAASPWVREVISVRRVYTDAPGDTLAADCVFRVPTALVKWQDYYWLVDGEGYKMPEQYTAAQARQVMFAPDGKLRLRVIIGVTHPPVESGKLWPGDDLSSGLQLVKLLWGLSYAEEIWAVDVTNAGGRRDSNAAQLVLDTKYGTTVRWGRPPNATDYFVEAPTSQKLSNLAAVYDQMHRIDGGQPWLDVRFDKVTYPSPAAPPADSEQANTR